LHFAIVETKITKKYPKTNNVCKKERKMEEVRMRLVLAG
jgi:hypothetical protein